MGEGVGAEKEEICRAAGSEKHPGSAYQNPTQPPGSLPPEIFTHVQTVIHCSSVYRAKDQASLKVGIGYSNRALPWKGVSSTLAKKREGPAYFSHVEASLKCIH